MNVPQLRFKEFSGEWELNKLKDICLKIKDGTHFSPKTFENGEYKYLTSKNIKNGYLDFSNLEYVNKEDHQKIYSSCDVKKGDVLLTKDGTIGQSCVNELNEEFSLLSSVAFLRVKNQFNNYFLYHILVSDIGQNEINKAIAGQALKRITLTKINDFKFNYPSLGEQTKIASFLTAIDGKIAQLTQKHALLNQYKKGMMQQIFSQQLRFKDENGEDFAEWEENKLENYIIDYKKNTKVNDEFPVMTSSRKGLVFQKDYFGENRLTERDNTGFNIIPVDYITYRSRSDDGLFYFNLNKLGVTGIISTYYPVFSIKQGDNHFFVEMLNWHKHKFIGYAVGTSQLVLSINELKNMIFKIPLLPEQTKITNFLSSIDQKIDQVAAQLDATKQYKRGLLQQMFV